MSQFIVYVLTTEAFNTIYTNILFSVFIIFLYQLLKRRIIYLNMIKTKIFWILYLFSVSYWVFGASDLRGFEYYVLTPLLVFMSGWVMCELFKDPQNDIKKVIYTMILGYGTHVFLNYITNIGKPRWLLTDYFTGSIRTATGSGVINTLIFSLIIVILLTEKKKSIKIISIICFCLSVLYALVLGTRTQIGILLVMSVIMLVLYFHEKKGGIWPIKFISTVIVLSGIIFLIYQNNLFDFRELIENSNLIARFDVGNELAESDERRIDGVFNGLVSVIEHPFGGLSSTHYFHNMWFDIGRVAGILPMILMVIYSVLTMYHVYLIFRDKTYDMCVRYLLMATYLGINFNMFFEPVIEGIIGYFLEYILLNGIVECLYYSRYKTRRQLTKSGNS